jgi:rubredoxin
LVDCLKNLKKNYVRNMSMTEKYGCQVCGHIYDPEDGDPDAGISPGTTFASLPGTWRCPVCGSPKEKFTMM